MPTMGQEWKLVAVWERGTEAEPETRGPVAILFLFAPALQVSLSECRAVAAGAAQAAEAAEALVGIYKYIFRFA